MARLQTSNVTRELLSPTPYVEKTHRPRCTVQKETSGPENSTSHASCSQASTAKVVIVAVCTTAILMMLIMITTYAVVVRDEQIFRELLNYTGYLMLLVIFSAAGPQMAGMLVGVMAKIIKR